MKYFILTALVITAVSGQLMYSSLLPSQYQKSSSLMGIYPANYPMKFSPYPANYPQNFHPNYPMNMHQYLSIMQVAKNIPMQVPQTQAFPLTMYPLNIQQHPLQQSQITEQTPQTQNVPVIEEAKIPKMHQIWRHFQHLLEPLKRTGRKGCLRSIWANGPGCVLEQLKAESQMDIEKGTMEMKKSTIWDIWDRNYYRILTLLDREMIFNEEHNYKENIDNNVPIVKSIFKKEFNLNLTDFQVKDFLPNYLPDVDKNITILMIKTLSTFLSVNTDENGELSLQELTTFIKSTTSEFIRESFVEEESGQMIIKKGVAMIDLDRDDKLSFGECQKFVHKVLKIKDENLLRGFSRLLIMFSDTDNNDTLSLHELSTVFQLVYETFQNILEEEESEKVVKDKESVQDFTRFWFLLADSDENDELSLQEISSFMDIFAECVQYPSIFFNVVQCVQYEHLLNRNINVFEPAPLSNKKKIEN